MWFGLIGPLLVRHDDVAFIVPAAKQRILLAALLLAPGSVVSSARLTELAWNGEPPAGAAVTLRSYIGRLRRALGPAGQRIVTADSGYLINVAEDEIDLPSYARLCGKGEAALQARSWQETVDLLDEAERLWRGSPLADIPCQALKDAEVHPLEQLRQLATQWQIEADLQLGHFSKVVPQLYALTAGHPLLEPFHYQLMVALYRSGRQADALAAYRHARGVLVREIGVEPGPELQLLHQRILAGDADLAAPAERLTSAAPQAAVPRQLPSPAANFVGRAAELDHLTALLKARTARRGTAIALIAGAAGVGKTTLALHWAHQVAVSFPDGQIFLNLNGFGPAGPPVTQGEAVTCMLEALQVPAAGMPATHDGRVGLYRTLLSERRMLIVLDNAKNADQVRALLPGGGGCVVLITSRSPLPGLIALDDARGLTLAVLTEAEARAFVTLRLGTARTTADFAATDQLISACAGLPLALAIVAALVATRPGMSLTTAAHALLPADRRLDALSTGDAAASVRAVLDWSYQALTPQAARMFRLLAEHPGPDISVPAAASLAGLTRQAAGEVLLELARLHLVTEHVHDRYACHDLLRLYASEQLAKTDSSAERRAAGRRMLDHYLHTARQAAHAISPYRELIDLRPPAAGAQPEVLAEPEQATAWLKAEHQGLMRLVGYAAQQGFDRHAWQLPWALTDFLNRAGQWHDFAASQRIALAAAIRLGDVAAQAYAHRYIGRACFELQDLDGSFRHLTSALDLRRQLGEPLGEAGISIDLCRLHHQCGQLDVALDCAQRALRLYQEHEHEAGKAFALHSVGWHHALLGNYPAALRYCNLALELCQQLDYKVAEAHTWHSLGVVHQRTGRPAMAVTQHRRAIAIYEQLGELVSKAAVLTDLGQTLLAAGDVRAAHSAWREALAILDELHHPDAVQLRAIIASTGARTDSRALANPAGPPAAEHPATSRTAGGGSQPGLRLSWLSTAS